MGFTADSAPRCFHYKGVPMPFLSRLTQKTTDMKKESFLTVTFFALVNVLFSVLAYIMLHFVEPVKRNKGIVPLTLKKVARAYTNAKAWLYAFMARWHVDSCNLLQLAS